MKSNSIRLLFFVLTLLTSQVSYAQVHSLLLQPGPSTGKDAMVISLTPETNYGSSTGLVAKAMLNGSQLEVARAFIQFNLSSIPQSAVIQSAKLDLYYDPTSPIGGHVGDNQVFIRRIISNWDENTITYNNQPQTTESHRVYLPMASSSHQDYTAIAVTQLVQDMVNNPSTSFGFAIRLINEQIHRALVLASSDHGSPSLRPRLFISYTLPCSIINGTVVYNNTAENPIPGAKVYIANAQGTLVDSTVANNSGNFTFNICEVGPYTISAKSSLPWKGVNATDALIALKHYSGLAILDGVRYLAGDVNKDGSINSTDALLIAKRYLEMISSFAAKDWVSSSYTVTLPVSGEVDVTIKMLNTGDLDASRAF